MRSARRFAVLLAGLAAGCIYPPPLPLAMAPADAVALAEPKSDQTLAVLDFADERPAFERSPLDIDEQDVGGRWFANDRYFSFHADDGTLGADPAPPGDLRGRVTGEGAFAWYPFPNHGIGKPHVRPVAQGLPDYLALSIEQRGLFAKVVRVKDEAEASAVGANLVLRGRIDRFATLLAEAHDPFVPRPDDWVQFRLLAYAQFQTGIGGIGEPAWLEGVNVGRDEDPQFFDKLNAYRGNQARPMYQLDAGDFPTWAQHDMAMHALRALERATQPLLADLERAVELQAAPLPVELPPAEPPPPPP